MNNGLKRARFVALVLVVLLVVYYVFDIMQPVDQKDQLTRIIHLEDRRELSGRLKSYLDEPDPEVRKRAAMAVGRIGGPGSVDPLMEMLTDSVWDVASTAATAIGFTGRGDQALRLLETAGELPPRITGRAIESVGRLADSSMTDVIDLLATFLSHPSPAVRERTVMALFRAGAKDKAGAIQQLALAEPDDSVRIACLYYLARFDVGAAKEIFERHIANPDPYLRSLAVRGMGAVNDADARRYLSMAMNDNTDRVVAQAIYELAGDPSREITQLLERKLNSEENEKLLVELIRALQRHESADGVIIAQKTAATYRTAPIVAATARYTAAVQKGRSLEYIDSLLRVEESLVRAACAEALGLIGDDNVIPRLSTLFADEDPMVRAAAFTTLMTIDTANHTFYIRKGLDDPDYVVTSLAVDQVGQTESARFLPILHGFMVNSDRTDVDVRRSTIGAMPTFASQDPPDSTVVSTLLLGMDDPNYIVRREAAEVWEEHMDQARPAVSPIAETHFSESRIRDALEKYEETNPTATIITAEGEFEIELLFDIAPLTVLNFIELANEEFYSGLQFHRVIPNFVAQGGDPRSDGWGGPDYYIRDEYSTEPYLRGTVGIATSGKDTGGSQFFITLSPQPHLEGRYTVFGRVLYGMEVVDLITVGSIIQTIHIHEG